MVGNRNKRGVFVEGLPPWYGWDMYVVAMIYLASGEQGGKGEERAEKKEKAERGKRDGG